MDVGLVYSPALTGYDLGREHPLKPERFALAVALLEAYGLVPAGTSTGAAPGAGATPLRVLPPVPAGDEQLLRVHSPEYVAAVKDASEHPGHYLWPRAGLGSLDTPVFRGMHEASALVAGGSLGATRAVLSGDVSRAFSIAGGLHHAHRDRAAGFCVYNDCAVAIADALEQQPEMRALYIDIDAHHGDGVQEAFWNEPRVLTVSAHETGLALYPGTGFANERGGPDAPGSAANVALPPWATDACYRIAFDEAVLPLARRFAPDLVFAQCGADAHHDDPITSLGLTLPGYRSLVRSIISLSAELCDGRLVVFGGGGYGWEHVVPRAWTMVAADLATAGVPEDLPEEWRTQVRAVAGVEPPHGLSEDRFSVAPAVEERLVEETRSAVASLMEGA